MNTINLKIIRDDAELEEALGRLRRLWGSAQGTQEAEDFEVLALLIQDYERKNHPIDPPSSVDAILFRMEQMGLRPVDLVPVLGARSRVSEILSGKRPLTLQMIRRLHADLGIPLDSLVGQESRAAA